MICSMLLALVVTAQDAPEPRRDFPPLRSPHAVAPDTTWTSPPNGPKTGEQPPSTPPNQAARPDSTARYLLGVGDELTVTVIGQPELSRVIRVLPDGSITYPGVEGTLFVLGRTPEEAGLMLKEKLGRLLRYPELQLMVTAFGAQLVYVMGEVEIPGDHEWHKGMTALQALAQAGGFKSTGKGNSVVVVRRTGPDSADVYQLDLRHALEQGGAASDLAVQPFDIIYVPRTFIANFNLVVDQWLRQNISPFTLYIEGWNAFHINSTRTIIR